MRHFFLLIPAGISDNERQRLRDRFEKLHDQDIKAAINNKITKITAFADANIGHQQQVNARQSILDEPFSISDILKSLDRPRAAQFIKEWPDTDSLVYRRIYEFFFDQYIGKRQWADRLNCNFLTVVLVNSDNNTYCQSGGKNICLLSFSCNTQATLPTKREDVSSNENGIVKIWAANQLDHRDYLVSGKNYRPLDSRRIGAPLYDKCLYPTCYSCCSDSSDSSEENDSVGYPAGASYSGSGTGSAASTSFNQPNSGGGGEQETPFQQHSNKPLAQTPPPHHFQPPRTLIPENHPLQEQNETVKNSTEIEKKPRIHQQHLPKTTKKRSMPEPDPGTVPNPAKKLAYTCDLVWPVAANIGDGHFGKRLQKMFGETIDIVQQGLLRLEA